MVQYLVIINFLFLILNVVCGKSVLAISEIKKDEILVANNYSVNTNRKSWIDEDKIIKKIESIDFIEEYNRFKGYKIIRPKHFEELGGINGVFNLDQIRLNIIRYEGEDSSTFYYARIVYVGDGWAFLNSKAYLIINGTERISLDGYGSERESEVGYCSSSGCMNVEGIRVIIPDEIMLKMSQANSIEILIEGERKSFDAYFKKDHHAQVRKFLNLYSIKDVSMKDE